MVLKTVEKRTLLSSETTQKLNISFNIIKNDLPAVSSPFSSFPAFFFAIVSFQIEVLGIQKRASRQSESVLSESRQNRRRENRPRWGREGVPRRGPGSRVAHWWRSRPRRQLASVRAAATVGARVSDRDLHVWPRVTSDDPEWLN